MCNGLQYPLGKTYAMQTITEEIKKRVVKLHIQDGRTIASLAAEYGICHATVSN
jgi:transposase